MAVLCLVFIPYALGHYLSCLLRTVNAILAPQLMAAATLTPAELGVLTSAYFFAFALFQLPEMEGVPPMLAGRLTLSVRYVWTGSAEEGERWFGFECVRER